MQTKLLLLILFLGCTEIYAQNIYVPGTVVKGKNAAYRCTKDNEYIVIVKNVKNIDTTTIRYYMDGTIVPNGVDADIVLSFKNEDMYQTFQGVITNEEFSLLKERMGGLFLYVVADSQGNTTELTFRFMKTDPVMTKMNPDRLFLLEQKLKKIIKITQTASSLKSIRNPKYLLSITYKELK